MGYPSNVAHTYHVLDYSLIKFIHSFIKNFFSLVLRGKRENASAQHEQRKTKAQNEHTENKSTTRSYGKQKH